MNALAPDSALPAEPVLWFLSPRRDFARGWAGHLSLGGSGQQASDVLVPAGPAESRGDVQHRLLVGTSGSVDQYGFGRWPPELERQPSACMGALCSGAWVQRDIHPGTRQQTGGYLAGAYPHPR